MNSPVILSLFDYHVVAFKLVLDPELFCQLTARYCGHTHQTLSQNIADSMSWYNMSTRWQLPSSEAETISCALIRP